MTSHVTFDRWSDSSLRCGQHDGTSVDGDGLVLQRPVGTTRLTDPFGSAGPQVFDYGSWTSPVVSPGFALTSLVASWNASTPPGTWIEVAVRARDDEGSASRWHVLGRWAELDPDLGGAIHRATVSSRADDFGHVDSDTFHAARDRAVTGYQLRVGLHRRSGLDVSPTLSMVGAMASRDARPEQVETTCVTPDAVRVLDVPPYSQRLHVDEYPRWGKGGRAWCSATSTSMVLDYWRLGPEPDDYAWVESTCGDPFIDHAARHTYDYRYEGAGNWPFNTAYAARFGASAFVTRLRSLSEAEQFIARGIPLVVSVSFELDELDGAGYRTDGHLMVLVGFTEAGDVVVNDPNSHRVPSNDEVRAVFDRHQFEAAWVPRSGGLVYVIHPPGVSLPPPPTEANW